ncbi:MAG: Rne/Rng family ribonuclease [Bacteroidota bacterium]
MSNEIIINTDQAGNVHIALMRDKKLIELHHEKADNAFLVGDIYLGTVNKIMVGLNSAFVDVGHEKDAFLHYHDLGPQIQSLHKYTKLVRNGKQNSGIEDDVMEPDIEKHGKINTLLSRFQQVVVQVVKEPISNKGPRLSSEISLPGRFIVLIPFDNNISISKKIVKHDERNRLKKLMQTIKQPNFGVIIRTNAEGVSVEELQKDLEELMAKWEIVYTQLKTAKPPQKLLGESERTLTLIRDLVNEDFTGIHVNDSFLYNEIKNYVKSKSPQLEKIVKHYTNTKQSIFEHFDIDKQIKASFGKEANFMGGCYLIIEHTEAMHVIDVNSGNMSGKNEAQEENALRINLEAASEIARQLRLRDMGGIIVVDFIDQKTSGNRKLVYEKLKEEMKSDRAKHKILPMSPFGLVEITRQRVRPEMTVITTEKCPTCRGTGEIQNSVVLLDEIENQVKYLIENVRHKGFSLELNPYLVAYFTKGGLKSPRMKWFLRYKRWIKIKPVNSLSMLDYRFIDRDGEAVVF